MAHYAVMHCDDRQFIKIKSDPKKPNMEAHHGYQYETNLNSKIPVKCLHSVLPFKGFPRKKGPEKS